MRCTTFSFQKNSLVWLLVFFFLTQINTLAQVPSEKPVIKRVVPNDIIPDMFIGVVGKGLYSENSKERVIFTQENAKIETDADGGGLEEDGLWAAKVRVPLGLKKGICKIEFEVNGQISPPFFVNISPTAKPPELTSVSSAIVNPGYSIWIGGVGFIYNQKLEITDGEGQVFTDIIYGVSGHNSLLFNVPKSAYSGVAKIKVIENRNGQPQSSNEIVFEIRRGPIPLSLNVGYFAQLSKGQWFKVYFDDSRPLYRATKIQFLLTQGHRKAIFSVSNFLRLAFQVPKHFEIGKMQVQTRTWVVDEVSEWSKPLDFEIVRNPKSPVIQGLETFPIKAETMYKQNGKTVGRESIYFNQVPVSSIPPTIPKGNLKVLTRYWDKGKFTTWKTTYSYDNFNIESFNDANLGLEFYKKKIFSFEPFFKRLFFDTNPSNNSVMFLKTQRDRNLVIHGDFYVASHKDLQLLLKDGKRRIIINPLPFKTFSAVIFRLRKNIPRGIWRVSVINKAMGVATEIPVHLKFD